MKDENAKQGGTNLFLDDKTEVTKRLSEQELSKIISSKPPVKDKPVKNQLILLTGQDAGKFFMLDTEEIIGRDLNVTLRVSDTTVSRRHARILRSPSGRYYIEDLGSQNGTWVNGVPAVRRTPLKAGDKIRIGVKTIFLFTQQDNIELHLLELRKMESLGRLARGIAHDFNNLLATVMLNINYIEVMSEDGVVDLDELAVSIDQTKIALKQAANMTEQLLGFARKGRYDERPQNVSSIVEETISLVRRTFDRAVLIETELEPDLWVVGDRSQLIQVLMNLCINARDAMPKGGMLKISSKLEHLDSANLSSTPFLAAGPHVVVAVSDTGVGMDEKILQHIFEPFFSTKGLGKGNGLGLATVYGVVKNHGGEIRVDSEPGKGTTFTVYLPASEVFINHDEERQTGQYTIAPATSGIVMLVEDDDHLRVITEKTLAKLGYRVTSCVDGVEAVETYKALRPQVHLVLLDLILPKLNGHDVFRQIRTLDPTADIVIISGYSEDRQLRDLMADGAAAFIKKPYSADYLASVIADVLAKRTDRRDIRPTAACPEPYRTKDSLSSPISGRERDE
jgi:signal transduction histidine kinase/CheY-like chemotaxis protein